MNTSGRQQSSFNVSASIIEFLYNNIKYDTISEEDYLSEIVNNDLEGLDPMEEVFKDLVEENEFLSNDENKNLPLEDDFKTMKVKKNRKPNHKIRIDETTNKFFCSQCNYSSIKRFYVLRHYNAIHTEPGVKVNAKGRKIIPRKKQSYNRIDETTNRIYCKLCSYNSDIASNVFRHYNNVHVKTAESGYTNCPKCLKKMHSSELENHTCGPKRKRPKVWIHDPKMRIDESTNQYFCSLCSFCSPSFSRVLRHYDGVHAEVAGFTKCQKCNVKLHSSELDSHSCVFYPCDICGKEYTSIKSVAGHKRSQHVELCSINCHLCGKLCESKKDLKNHEKREHSEKIPCQICGANIKSFQYTTHLKYHEEKATCDICNKEVRNLKDHKLSMHTNDEEKPFKCSDCWKGFPSSDSLQKHKMSVHLKLRPYKCRFGCTFAYNDASNRNTHEKKTHGGLFHKVNKIGDEN